MLVRAQQHSRRKQGVRNVSSSSKFAFLAVQALLVRQAFANQSACEPMPPSIVKFEYVSYDTVNGTLHVSLPALVDGAKFAGVNVSVDQKYYFHLMTESNGSRVEASIGLPLQHEKLRFDITYDDLKRKCIRQSSVTFENGKRLD